MATFTVLANLLFHRIFLSYKRYLGLAKFWSHENFQLCGSYLGTLLPHSSVFTTAVRGPVHVHVHKPLKNLILCVVLACIKPSWLLN